MTSTERQEGSITEDGRADSYFIIAVANFFHFILVQTVALLLAIIAEHYTAPLLSFLGLWSLVYSVLVGLAMAMQLFQTARIVNAAAPLPDESKRNTPDKETKNLP